MRDKLRHAFLVGRTYPIQVGIVALLIVLACTIGCHDKTPITKSAPVKSAAPISKPSITENPSSQPVEQPPDQAVDKTTNTNSSGDVSAAPTTPETVAETSTPKTSDPETVASEHASANPETTTPADSTVASTETQDQPPAPAEPQPTPQRIMLLAPGGPLLIDLVLTIDGRPHDEVFSTVVRDALSQADADHDGKTSWDEVTQDSRMRYGELGNLPSRNENERVQLIKMYDMNRNGFADEVELQRFLTRNGGASKSFNLRSSNYYRDSNRWDSSLRLLLDADDDGALNAEEFASAVNKMKARDADDDDVLLLDDLIEITPDDVGPLQRRRSNQTESAILLNGIDDWGQALYTLEEMYSLGQSLDASSFEREPQAFAELDGNGDGEVRSEELTRLLEIPPHLILEMDFGKRPDADATAKPQLLRLVGHPRDLPVEITESSITTRLTCAWSDVTVVFFARDEGVQDYLATAKSQVMQYDANKDGYLEKSEIPEFFADQVAEFSVLDADKDEKVYAEELASFQEKQGATMRSQLRARAGEDRDALYSALDDDHDGRLTAREIARAPARMANMDQNRDGMLIVDEIPTAMLLGVVRANPQQDDQLFVPPTAAQLLAQENLPAWFTSMDVNRDGEISRREFLGDLSLFDQMDTNDDAFLNVAEAVPKENEATGQ